VAHLRQHRSAEFAAAADDEIHQFGSRLLGRADEIPFVFAVFRVDHDDHLATGDGIDSFRHGRQAVRHKRRQK
jgi:hypothetical protein